MCSLKSGNSSPVLSKIFKSSEESEIWNHVTFYITDTPSDIRLPFEERLQLIRDKFPSPDQQVQIANYLTCKNLDDFNTFQNENANGLFLRKPRSLYTDPESLFIYRVKRLHKDLMQEF